MDKSAAKAGRAEALAFILAEYVTTRRRIGPVRALEGLRHRLGALPALAAQECAAALATQGENTAALTVLEDAIRQHPDSRGIRVALADALCATGDFPRAEGLVSELAAAGHPPALGTLAKVLRNQGKVQAAVAAMKAAAAPAGTDLETLLYCVEFLRDCQQHDAALDLCSQRLALKGDPASSDPRLLAMAGLLASALGRFEQGRAWLEAALAAKVDLNLWFVAQALADCQKYTDPKHPDLTLMRGLLDSPGLGPRARASILFGLAKAHDDLKDYAAAAALYRDANRIAGELSPWSPDHWREFVAHQLAAPINPSPPLKEPAGAPVFVVGMPRSGTTLVAEMLGRHPQVANRGELGLVSFVRKWLEPRRNDPAALEYARGLFQAHLRQDDAPASWYVDKNPLNFMLLGTVEVIAPNARVIWCRRDHRDTALSLWRQFFARADAGYAYRFEYIAELIKDSERMMAHWQRRLKLPVLEMPYEGVVADPAGAAATMTRFLDLPEANLLDASQRTGRPIATASVWQARQPVYRSSVGQWQHYAPHVPELERYFPNSGSSGTNGA